MSDILKGLWDDGESYARRQASRHEAGHALVAWILLGRPNSPWLASLELLAGLNNAGVVEGGARFEDGILESLSTVQHAAVILAGRLSEEDVLAMPTFDIAQDDLFSDPRAIDDWYKFLDLTDENNALGVFLQAIELIEGIPERERLVGQVAKELLAQGSMTQAAFGSMLLDGSDV